MSSNKFFEPSTARLNQFFHTQNQKWGDNFTPAKMKRETSVDAAVKAAFQAVRENPDGPANPRRVDAPINLDAFRVSKVISGGTEPQF